MKPLSKKQSIAFDWIRNFIDTHPYSPSLVEIAEGLGVKSPTNAKYLVDRLVELGYLKYEPGAHRSIRVVK